MSLEYDVLHVFLEADYHYRFRDYIQDHQLSAPGKMIIETLDQVFKAQNHPDKLTPKDVAMAGATFNPQWSGDDHEVFAGGIDKLGASTKVGAQSVLKTWVEREAAAVIADQADRYVEKPMSLEDGFFPVLEEKYLSLRNTLRQFEDDEDAQDFEADFESVLDRLAVNGDWGWRLRCLRESVGNIYPGMFVVIGGRPEAGKTTFVCSEAAHLAPQMPEDALMVFFNNESHGDVLRERFMQSVVGWKLRDIKAFPRKAQAEYDRIMQGREVLIKDIHGKSIQDVERVIDKYSDRIKLIVFDQASKVLGYENKAGNNAARLQQLASRLKAISTQVAPVITTMWADGTAEGEKYIEQNQLYDSKTGIPGEAEVIITIGHTKEESDKFIRYLNIPKNKSLACPDERNRHSKHMVRMLGYLAQVVDR